MTDERLEEIRKRAEAALKADLLEDFAVESADVLEEDVPELLAEIERLQYSEYLLNEKLYVEQQNWLEINRKKNEALAEVERLKEEREDDYLQQRADEERAVFYDEED